MKQNVGVIDKIIRGVLGLFLIYIAAIVTDSSILSTISFIVGLLLILTSMFGFCFLYTFFGISTKHEKTPPSSPMN